MTKPGSIVENIFGIKGTCKELAGYVDKNYLVTSESGERYVLKLSHVSKGLLKAQNELLKYLEVAAPGLELQRVVSASGGDLHSVEVDGIEMTTRLLTYLEGVHFAETEQSMALSYSLGKYLGKLTKSLEGFSHVEFKARVLEWDIQRAQLSSENLQCIENPTKRKLAHYFLLQFQERVAPNLPKLRHSVIYGDANDWNILTDGEEVTGVIDFGDAVYTQTINELAIAITYAVMGKDNPIEWACSLVKGYNEEFNLERPELDVLYYLIAARLCISVCTSAKSRLDNPENEYISISEKPAWSLISKWIQLNPEMVRSAFYEACGLEVSKNNRVETLNKERDRHISHSLSLSYNNPIHMNLGSFQYMHDAGGKTYLDLVNNIMHVGHCHPAVVEAGQRQMAILNTNTRYHYDLLYEYTERLSNYFASDLNKIFLLNSGSAASDLAIRIAKTVTAREKVMVMDHGYHGNTMTGIEISPYKFQGRGGFTQSENILKAELPDLYRDTDGTIEKYISDAKSQMDDSANSLAAFIAEPIVGCGGQVPLPSPYLKEIYNHIRSKGGLAIADEVQTGFGRIGSHFWAFEQQEAKPDIVVLGKPMGNGHPLAAVVTTTDIAEAFDNGMEFFSSFGGNPVSCAIGKAVLETIEEENLQLNALKMGERIMDSVNELKRKYPVIGDVRGSGLFLGIELIENDKLSPATDFGRKLINRMKDGGILLSTDGPFNNVIKIKPPLCINEEDVDFFLDTLDKELANLT